MDARDLLGLARFWTRALNWRVLSEREREVVIGPDENAPVGMLDLTTVAEDRDAEIERLLALDARRVDIGHTGAESWTVLAAPEGNELCVIRPKTTLTR